MSAIAKRIEHERVWRRVRATLVRDDLADAVASVDAIAAEDPGDPEARLYSAWTHVRLADGDPSVDLDTLAREAFVARAALALPLCILGHAALRRGDLLAARSSFRHAVEADASILEAVRGLRITEHRLAHPPPRARMRFPWGRVIRELAAATLAVSSAFAVLLWPA